MNWKKIALITILILYGFGFSIIFGYTPLTNSQLERLQETIRDRVEKKEITPNELYQFDKALQAIPLLRILQKNRNIDKKNLDDTVIESLPESMIKRLNLEDHFNRTQFEGADEEVVLQDLKNIHQAIQSTGLMKR